MSSWKKYFLLALMLVLAVAVFGCTEAAQPEGDEVEEDLASEEAVTFEPTTLSFATGSEGGSYYPVGVGISELIKNYIPNVTSTAEVTGAAMENNILVGTDSAQLGMSTGDTAYKALYGLDPYEEEYDQIRLMFAGLAPGTSHFMVLADSGIETFHDLVGKRVSPGPRGSAGAIMFEDLAQIYGYTLDDFNVSYLGFAEGSQALVDGNIDMNLVTTAFPASAVREAEARKEIRLLNIEQDILDAFIAEFPYYRTNVIPAEVYDYGQDVSTIACHNMVITHAGMDEDLIYEITKVVFENIEEFYQSHPSAIELTFETATDGPPVPYHLGAARYFAEQGYTVETID